MASFFISRKTLLIAEKNRNYFLSDQGSKLRSFYRFCDFFLYGAYLLLHKEHFTLSLQSNFLIRKVELIFESLGAENISSLYL